MTCCTLKLNESSFKTFSYKQITLILPIRKQLLNAKLCIWVNLNSKLRFIYLEIDLNQQNNTDYNLHLSCVVTDAIVRLNNNWTLQN